MTHQIIRPRSSYCRIALLALAGASFWLAVGRAQAPSAPPAPAAKAPPSDAPPSSVPDEAAAASEEPAEPAEPSLQLETIPAVEPVPPNVLRTVGNNNFSAPGFVNLKIFSPTAGFLRPTWTLIKCRLFGFGTCGRERRFCGSDRPPYRRRKEFGSRKTRSNCTISLQVTTRRSFIFAGATQVGSGCRMSRMSLTTLSRKDARMPLARQ